MDKEKKAKKPIYKRWWFYVLILLLVAGIFGGGGKKDAAPAPAAAETPAPALAVDLDASAPGDYGREITLNAGSESPYTYIGFYLPAGTYRASYTGGGAWAQLTFYMDGVTVNEDGVEEPTMSEQPPLLVKPGETPEFTLSEGEYIKLPDGETGVHLEKVG